MNRIVFILLCFCFEVHAQSLEDLYQIGQYSQAIEAFKTIAQPSSDDQIILAKLENDALESGLEEVGDFKLSLAEYEKLLDREKFEFSRTKIGPSDIDDVGGVYVYEIKKSRGEN